MEIENNLFHFRQRSKGTLLLQAKCDGDSIHAEGFRLLLKPQKRAMRSSLLVVSAHLTGMRHANEKDPALRELLSSKVLGKIF